MASRLTYQRKSRDSQPLQSPANDSVVSSDGTFQQRTGDESPVSCIRGKRRCKPRYDPYEWELDINIMPSRRVDNTTTVSNVSLVESKAVNIKEKPISFDKNTSSCISDVVSTEMDREESPDSYPRKRMPMQRCRSDSAGKSKRISKAASTSILPKQMMNIVFDHCFRSIWSESPEEKREMCTFLTCYYFNNYALEQMRVKVLSWIKRLHIFSKQYVFVPILFWSHWSLLIFCHLGESLDSKTKTPCMLLLDSLHIYGSPSRLEPLIRRLVVEIFEMEGRVESKEMVEKIPLLVPKVPQQWNCMDCGIFVLYYIKLFLENAPQNFSISHGYPYSMEENWFTRKEVKEFYDKLEALGLQTDDDEEE